MKIEERFNLRSAQLVETQAPAVSTGGGLALGIRVCFMAATENDYRSLAMHLTPDEALQFASKLIDAARKQLTT